MDVFSDILITIFGAEEVATIVPEFFEALFSFLGEDLSIEMFSVIEELRPEGINVIKTNFMFNEEGTIVNPGKFVTVFGVEYTKLLNFLGALAQKIGEAGYNITTEAGREIFNGIIDTIHEYSGYINAAGLGAFVQSAVDKYKQKNEPSIVNQQNLDQEVLP